MTDIMLMLRQAQAQAHKAQSEENNSVATFFNSLANSKQSTNPTPQSMPIPIIKTNQMTLESIERNIPKISPSPLNHDTQNLTGSHNNKNDLANSPLAQFINSNNLNALKGAQEVKNSTNSLSSTVISCSKPTSVTTQTISKGMKETKTKETKLLITPNDLLSNGKSGGDKKLPKQQQQQKPEPLTQAQLMQSLKYLIDNDSDFTKKIHDAYIKSVNKK
ncbi:hypothetical protein PVAND_012515 [Polypedilum vanderplanki]|uniref:mRNA-decapping enzyme C-terminal domain-containing protein n=1 Tax=Polypedilum vanderplanki TaxID=319348 RepID=A0A9J6CMN4_POLVA|nr:hypothetical protein PVAND_012515 [Polypedilum vanderplanki]